MRAGRGRGSSPLDLLVASFDGVDRRLCTAVVEYLLEGSDEAFPLSLGEGERSMLAAIDGARRADFYLDIAAVDPVDDGVLVRLGRLLAQLQLTRYPVPPNVPASSWALHDDVSFSLFRSGKSVTTSLWTIERLARLLTMDGVTVDRLDVAVIDLLIGSTRGWGGMWSQPLRWVPGVAEFAAAHPEATREALGGFAQPALLELAGLASAHPPLAESLVAHFASESAEPVAARRKAGLAVLAGLPARVQLAELEPLLARAKGSGRRGRLIAAVARVPDAAAAAETLQRELARVERGAGEVEVRQAIARLGPPTEADPPRVFTPAPLVPLPESPLSDAAIASMRDALLSERERIVGASGERPEYLADRLEQVERALQSLPGIIAYLSGEAAPPVAPIPYVVLSLSNRFVDLAPVNRIRLGAHPGGWSGGPLLLGARDVDDARAIVDVLVRAGRRREDAVDAVVKGYLVGSWEVPSLAPAQMVAFMHEYPEPFDRVLGLAVGHVGYDDHRSAVLEILEAAPVLGARYAPVVAELATGPAKAHRGPAQRVLARHGLARGVASAALESRVADERTAAARWIEALGGDEAIALLGSAVSRERTPSVRAVMIAGLERLGDDVSRHLRPAAFEREAAEVLAARVPTSLLWFTFDELPPCRYADGTEVPSDVVRSWVVLAARLRDPLGAGLLPLYVQTLDGPSAEALSRRVLLSWIARDTAPLDDATVLQKALHEVGRYERRIAGYSRSASELVLSLDEIFDALERQRMTIAGAAPSAIADKGVLALAGEVPGLELAETVRHYMRRNHLKRAQIEALLHVLTLSRDPEPLQLLVACARRHRTASVQKAAAALVEQVAERRGWTPDELGDRMIPTVGLDIRREILLDFGGREFTARLTPELTLEIVTSDGLPVRALPEPRVGEAGGPAAKALLAASRKELRAVASTQRRRLYDAMCARRSWRGAAWRELLLDHPVMGMLAAGVVWQVDARTFRPDVDGVIRDETGAEIDLADDALVTIAHPTSLDQRQVEAWRSRPSVVVAGFDQFRAVPVAATDQLRCVDREGGISTTFVLRGRAAKLEWNRGATFDDARFDEYVKSFPGLGFQGAITFSGSSLPETEQPTAFGALEVRRLSATGRDEGPVRFAEVPPALLAELVADYLAIGA